MLRLIEKEPTYGYEIVMQLKQVGFAEISESTLYPLLLRLEQQEKVTVERRPSPKGPSRKYYVITEKGTDSLLDFQQEWNRLCGLVEKIFREDRKMNNYFTLRRANRLRVKLLNSKSQEQIREVIRYLRRTSWMSAA